MLITGNQLRAARALVGIRQVELAEGAGIHIGTIRKMEAKGPLNMVSGPRVMKAVTKALDVHGVRFVLPGDTVEGRGVALADFWSTAFNFDRFETDALELNAAMNIPRKSS